MLHTAIITVPVLLLQSYNHDYLAVVFRAMLSRTFKLEGN